MSNPGETTLVQGQTFSTMFYNIFTISWVSSDFSKLDVSVSATTPSGSTIILVADASFRAGNLTQQLAGTDNSSGLTFHGMVTATFKGGGAAGNLTGSDMSFTLADGTEYVLTGDIGKWQ